ncbi:MAG TPA: VWA domain-containing protein [Acidobacteriota bacterium]|nr:VWA domain-containing protein [Acidobacteriota bacterium]
MRPGNDQFRSGCRSRAGIFTLTVIMLFLLAPAPAREPAPEVEKGHTPPAAVGYRQTSAAQEAFKLGVHVDLVMMYASAFDGKGNFVTGLTQENFRVYEDGIEQTIKFFAREDIPVSTGILLDISASMRGKSDQVNLAALSFINASNPDDELFLIGFNDEVVLLQDFTGDRDDIQDALQNVVVTGGTALYDAVYLGVQKAATGDRSKKAILLISDGEDKDSFHSLNEVMARIDETDVQVFSIGILDKVPQQSLFGRWSKRISQKAVDSLKKISESTGGKAFFPEALPEIHDIVAEVSRELRSQYSIGYVSSNTARDGSFRHVKIELTGPGTSNVNIRHRRGYFAPGNDSDGGGETTF